MKLPVNGFAGTSGDSVETGTNKEREEGDEEKEGNIIKHIFIRM